MRAQSRDMCAIAGYMRMQDSGRRSRGDNTVRTLRFGGHLPQRLSPIPLWHVTAATCESPRSRKGIIAEILEKSCYRGVTETGQVLASDCMGRPAASCRQMRHQYLHTPASSQRAARTTCTTSDGASFGDPHDDRLVAHSWLPAGDHWQIPPVQHAQGAGGFWEGQTPSTASARLSACTS